MKCSFEERKRELESECKISSRAMASASSRLDAFMKPYLVSYRRHEQATNATTVVQGLCSDLEHKNGESMAYLFGLAVPCNTTIRDLEIPAPQYGGTGRPAKRPNHRVDRWISARSEDEWTALEVRDGKQDPLVVEALKRRVETGQRSRPTVAAEVLVVIRYKDRDRAVVKTDYYLSNAAAKTSLAEFCRAAKAEHRIEE